MDYSINHLVGRKNIVWHPNPTVTGELRFRLKFSSLSVNFVECWNLLEFERTHASSSSSSCLSAMSSTPSMAAATRRLVFLLFVDLLILGSSVSEVSNRKSFEWQTLTKSNFSAQIRTQPHLLLLVTLPCAYFHLHFVPTLWVSLLVLIGTVGF